MSAGTVAWKPRAAIVGAGGMGALFGSILQSGGLGGGFSARMENIAAAFSAAGLETHGSRDIIHDIWKKLVGNIAMSAVSGAVNSTSAECLAVPELQATSLRALDEALAVAVSHGILLHRDEAAAGAETISKTGGTGDNKSSLCADLLNERPAEVDSIYGSIISKGRVTGVPAPTLDTLAAIVKGIESRNLQRGPAAFHNALGSNRRWLDQAVAIGAGSLITITGGLGEDETDDWLADISDVRLDRGMPGDGLIDLPLIRRWVEAAEYRGPIEAGIFSQRDWRTLDTDVVVQTILHRYGREF